MNPIAALNGQAICGVARRAIATHPKMAAIAKGTSPAYKNVSRNISGEGEVWRSAGGPKTARGASLRYCAAAGADPGACIMPSKLTVMPTASPTKLFSSKLLMPKSVRFSSIWHRKPVR